MGYARGAMAADEETPAEPLPCSACRGTGQVISNLGGSPSTQACPWCEAPLDATFSFCPRCGRSLGPVRLYRELVDSGMEEREARALLSRSGFEPF